MDDDSPTSWIALELTAAGDRAAEQGDLSSRLQTLLDLPDPPPVLTPGGYALVGVDDHRCASALHTSPLIESVLGLATGEEARSLASTLAQASLGIPETPLSHGCTVSILTGRYKGLSGTVDDIIGDRVVVYISLRSLEVLATVPLSGVEVLQ